MAAAASRRRRASLSLLAPQRLAALLLLALAAAPAAALQAAFDEVQWTKLQWRDHKLPYALELSNPSEEEDTAPPELAALLAGVAGSSLDGPRLARRPPHDLRTAELPAAGAAAAAAAAAAAEHLFTDASLVEHAAAAAQCAVCHTLVTAAWTRLAGAVTEGRTVRARRRRRPCRHLLPQQVLVSQISCWFVVC